MLLDLDGIYVARRHGGTTAASLCLLMISAAARVLAVFIFRDLFSSLSLYQFKKMARKGLVKLCCVQGVLLHTATTTC